MSEEDGFTLVKYKHPRPNKLKKKRTRDSKEVPSSAVSSETCDEQLLDKVINYIEQCKVELKRSPFYSAILSSIAEILSKNPENEWIFQDFVCYGIGRISECPTSRYQFALLVLLWQHYRPSGKCYMYDPIFCITDERIVEYFGMSLISENEEAKREVSQKTLFFVPHGGKPLYNNILWANWGTSLERVVIFGNSFESYQERLPSSQLHLEARYIAEILPHTHEVKLTSAFQHDDIFNDLSLHYFVKHELSQLLSSFWRSCSEPVYENDNTEIILNTS